MGHSDKKEAVLKKLKNTYCRLFPSKISGVGVFAVRDIPPGINPFADEHELDWIEFSMDELKDLDKEVLKMIDDFYVIEKDNSVLIHECALNGMGAFFFINSSTSPNILWNEDGSFTTLREIKKGEELTVNYSTYDYKYAN